MKAITYLIALLAMFVIGPMMPAALISAGSNRVVGFRVPFRNAFRACVIVAVGGFLFAVLGGSIEKAGFPDLAAFAEFGFWTLFMFACMARLIKRPDGESIGWTGGSKLGAMFLALVLVAGILQAILRAYL